MIKTKIVSSNIRALSSCYKNEKCSLLKNLWPTHGEQCRLILVAGEADEINVKMHKFTEYINYSTDSRQNHWAIILIINTITWLFPKTVCNLYI